MIRVEVGVFAHNEARNIVKTLTGLANQEATGLDVRLLVLANGCSDNTVELARAFAEPHNARNPGMRIEVIELAEGGKSRTWNRFVHELSRPDADILIFADADIELPASDSFLRLVRQSISRPELYVINSKPIKDIVYRPSHLGLKDKAIAMGSGTLNDWKKAICGQLYAMPAEKARSFHVPVGLPVEDGFIRAMILTDFLTIDEDLSRIDGDDVFHIFASERSVLALIRHQTRIVIGSAINSAIYGFLNEIPSAQRRAVLADAAKSDRWLPDVIESRLPQWPYGWVPIHYLIKRVSFIAGHPRKLLQPRQLATLILGLGFDLVVYLNAQQKMARGVGAGHW